MSPSVVASQGSGATAGRQWGVRACVGGVFHTLDPRISGWSGPLPLPTVDGVDIQFFPVSRVTPGRSICHLLVGAVVSMLATTLFSVLLLLWGAVVLSLAKGPSGGALLVVIYVIAVPALPLMFAWFVHEVAVLHRLRFHRLLEITIPEPAWTIRSTGRELVYHVWALLIAVPATLLIVVPPAAQRFVRHDRRTADRWLGPTNVEFQVMLSLLLDKPCVSENLSAHSK